MKQKAIPIPERLEAHNRAILTRLQQSSQGSFSIVANEPQAPLANPWAVAARRRAPRQVCFSRRDRDA